MCRVKLENIRILKKDDGKITISYPMIKTKKVEYLNRTAVWSACTVTTTITALTAHLYKVKSDVELDCMYYLLCVTEVLPCLISWVTIWMGLILLGHTVSIRKFYGCVTVPWPSEGSRCFRPDFILWHFLRLPLAAIFYGTGSKKKLLDSNPN